VLVTFITAAPEHPRLGARTAPDCPVRSTTVTSTPASREPRQPVPAPLAVAVSLVAVESVVLLLQALVLLPSLGGERLAMGATSVLFFLLYGGGLGFCA
jgi:hypothetical protein